jgi:hypothetical protein
MKNEERNPMKLLKTIFGNALIFAMSVTAVLLVMSILGQALALGFYAFLLAISAGAIAYLFFRSPN